ncbi:MAG: NAD(P)/FAD-dependent oxidoreductase [Acidobacteriota bacterium]
MRQIVIVGNGIAGITAARDLRKRCDDEILVISGESDHFYSRTALMYIYMGHMRYQDTKPYENFFWDKNRIRLARTWIETADVANQQLIDVGGQHYPYDALLLACGSKSRRFGWPGQNLRGVQGLYNLQDLERMEERTGRDGEHVERAVIVGGGLIGIEMAEMLLSRGIAVTFLVRESTWMQRVTPPEESEMINAEIRRHGIDLRLATELERIESDASGGVRAVVTTDGEEIPCQFVGLTIGVEPNVDWLRGGELEIDRGILVDPYLRTNIDDVYAIGDCAQLREPPPGRRPVEPLWYTGRMMGQAVASTLAGEPQIYDPGLWFNSAKFLDLEWQVYGTVGQQPREGEETLFWRHADGGKSLRINYRADTLEVVGFNVMGIRYRQEACEAWLRERRTMPWVLENLGAANFDPELYAQHEGELVAQWNAQRPNDAVTLRRKRGLWNLLSLRRAS